MSDAPRHQARIAPRSAWQAIDLGTRMYRRWWAPLTTVWLLTTLLPALALWWLWPGWQSALAPLLFWWLKPLWERPLLEYCARALFGERTAPLTLLRQFPRYGFSYLFDQLTWRRLSPSRSYHTPVFQLEKAPRKQTRQRLQVLALPPSSHGGALTLLTVHLEQGLAASLVVLAWVLFPWEASLTLEYWLDDQANAFGAAMLVAWYLAMTLLQPLYVCCGFALYLNKRTWLEGWDLEPGLGDIGRRRAAHIAPALALLLPLLCLAPTLEAAEPSVRDEAVEILAGEPYMPMQTEQAWRWKQPPSGDSSNFFDTLLRKLFEREPASRPLGTLPWLGELLRVLAWAALIAVMLWLLWSQRHRLAVPARSAPTRPRAPLVIQGLSLAPESLPVDVAAAIREALHEGDRRRALSLLYRATLAELHQRHGLRISAGATEGDVLRQLQQTQPDDPLTGFLARLTPAWVRTAWGRQPAADEHILALLKDWQHSGQLPGEGPA